MYDKIHYKLKKKKKDSDSFIRFFLLKKQNKMNCRSLKGKMTWPESKME